MKVKIIWMKEYADDGFSAHVAVDSGDWEEITEGQYEILTSWSRTLKSGYRGEYPVLARQDDQSIKDRILQCKAAIQKQQDEERDLEQKRKKRSLEAKLRAAERERKDYVRLQAKFSKGEV